MWCYVILPWCEDMLIRYDCHTNHLFSFFSSVKKNFRPLGGGGEGVVWCMLSNLRPPSTEPLSLLSINKWQYKTTIQNIHVKFIFSAKISQRSMSTPRRIIKLPSSLASRSENIESWFAPMTSFLPSKLEYLSTSGGNMEILSNPGVSGDHLLIFPKL